MQSKFALGGCRKAVRSLLLFEVQNCSAVIDVLVVYEAASCAKFAVHMHWQLHSHMTLLLTLGSCTCSGKYLTITTTVV